jgi:NodT family efflux transporter outer membrane factor (OMF) lipoprotein
MQRSKSFDKALGAVVRRKGLAVWRPFLLLLGSAVLSSCASIPDLGPDVQPATPGAYTSARSFNLPPVEWPTDVWWNSFGDPQLDALMSEALAHSPTIAQAEARLREALARTEGANAGLLPTLSANGSAEEKKLTYNGMFPREAVPKGWHDASRATLDFQWELDFWGKNRSALEAAVSEAKASKAAAAATRVVLTTALAQAYVQLQGLFIQHDILSEELRNRQDSETLVRRRHEQGLDSQTSLEQANARVRRAQVDLAEVNEKLRLSRNGIAALLGRGPDRGLDIQRPTLSKRRPFGLPSTLKADLLGRKPEVVAARWRVEAAAKRIGVARASFYPDINLAAFIGFESLGLNRLFSSGSDTGSVGPAIHLPIFDGGRLRANYRVVHADYDLAVANYDEALTQALRETADAALSLQALGAYLPDMEAALASSNRAYQLAKMRYEGGLSDFQTLLTTEDALLQAKSADAALQIRGFLLDIALVKALGGGFESSNLLTKVMP